MRDDVLCRKKAHIVFLLAEELNVSAEKAIELFYSTRTSQMLNDPKYGLQIMSDGYLLEDILNELSLSGEVKK